MSETLKNRGGQQIGVDMSYEHAKLIEIPNAIASRYDAGIVKHKYEHTGVVEIIHLGSKEECQKLLHQQ